MATRRWSRAFHAAVSAAVMSRFSRVQMRLRFAEPLLDLEGLGLEGLTVGACSLGSRNLLRGRARGGNGVFTSTFHASPRGSCPYAAVAGVDRTFPEGHVFSVRPTVRLSRSRCVIAIHPSSGRHACQAAVPAAFHSDTMRRSLGPRRRLVDDERVLGAPGDVPRPLFLVQFVGRRSGRRRCASSPWVPVRRHRS